MVSAQQGGGAGVSLPLVAMATGPNGPANDEAAAVLSHRTWPAGTSLPAAGQIG